MEEIIWKPHYRRKLKLYQTQGHRGVALQEEGFSIVPRPCKLGIQDSHGFCTRMQWILFSGNWNLDSIVSASVRFRILWTIFRIPKPMIAESISNTFFQISDSTSQNFSDSTIRILYMGMQKYFSVLGRVCCESAQIKLGKEVLCCIWGRWVWFVEIHNNCLSGILI